MRVKVSLKGKLQPSVAIVVSIIYEIRHLYRYLVCSITNCDRTRSLVDNDTFCVTVNDNVMTFKLLNDPVEVRHQAQREARLLVF